MLNIYDKLFSNFIILEDTEEINATDLFAAFLKYLGKKNSAEEIHVICLENTPDFYFQFKNIENSDKYIIHNFFNDSHSWNNYSLDIISVLSKYENFSGKILFFDSLSHLVIHFGFNAIYKILFNLKLKAKKIICLVHGDLFNSNQICELKNLSSTYIKIAKNSNKKNKTVDAIFKQSISKPYFYSLLISLKDDLSFLVIQNSNDLAVKEIETNKNDVKIWTTFKLGLNLSENEKKARNQLILPFLRNTSHSDKDGQIDTKGYEDEEYYDDPDDDLDF